VEIHGAICRLRQNQEISDIEKQASLMRLRTLRFGWRELVPDDSLRELARGALEKYPLRAADALQLAAALTWCQQRPRKRAFITADQRLAQAARSAGFNVLTLP
jgi:predicted nucleic acid-binding protein